MRGWPVAAVTFVLLTTTVAAPAARADDAVPPAVVTTWEPSPKLAGGGWKQHRPPEAQDVNAGKLSCKGMGRSWLDRTEAVLVAFLWFACPSSDADRWLAHLDDRRSALPATWQVRAGALGKDVELVEPVGPAHSRTWMQGDYLLVVVANCQPLPESACLEVSARAARDISGRFPGQRRKIAGNRQSLIGQWLLAVLVLWLLIIGIVAAVRARTRRRYAVTTGSARWRSVEAPARRHRRKARLRRFGALLLGPVAVFGLLSAPRVLAGGFDVNSLAVAVLLGIIGLPGAIMLQFSRDSLARHDWRWHQASRLPPLRRLASGLLSTLAVVLLLLSLLAFGISQGGDNILPLPEEVRSLVTSLAITLMLGTWMVSRLARRRVHADAWAILNTRAGPPLLYLRGLGGEGAKLRATYLARRGPTAWLSDLVTPQRRQRFEDVLAALLVRHGPVLAVDPPGRRLPRLGAATVALPARGWEARLGALASNARAIVLAATPNHLTHELLALIRLAGGRAAVTPIVLVLPPAAPLEVRRSFDRFYEAVADVEPFTTLGRNLVADGTHVLVHLPGRGWFGWGAGVRDEWTYTRTVHDALADASARWDRPAARPTGGADRRGATEGADAEPRRPPVVVLAATGDRATGAEIANGLAAMGLPVTRPQAGDDATSGSVTGGSVTGGSATETVVVVLSAAALSDPGWRAELERYGGLGSRPVPVRRGPVEAGEVPEALRTLNWVDWDGLGAMHALTEIFAAVTSDPSKYHLHRDLAAQARAWILEQRSDALLIGDYHAARRAADHIADSANDPLARPNALLYEFVQSSLAVARRHRHRGRGRLALGVLAVAVAALVAVSAVFRLRPQISSANLAGISTTVPIIAADHPDWAGLLAAATLLQGRGQEVDTARRLLPTLLDRAWPRAFVGAAHDARFLDAVAVAGDRLLTVDVRGSLTRWSLRTGAVEWRRAVDPAVDRLAATEDGSLVALGAGSSVHIIDTAPWHREVVEVRERVSAVAVEPGGKAVVVATGDGRLVTIARAPPHAIRRIGSFDKILDLVPGERDGQAWALVLRARGKVAIVDALRGRVLHEFAVSLPPDGEVGAIGVDGRSVALVRDDQELLSGTSTTGLRPTGQLMPNRVDDLAVLPGRRVVSATQPYGVRLFDGATGLVTAHLQVSQAGINLVRASTDGDVLLCSSGFGVYAWSTDGLSSTEQPGRPVAAGGTARADVGGTTARGGADGVVTVSAPSRSDYRVRAVTGAVTAVSLSRDGGSMVVGSDRGEVVEVDVVNRAVVRRWSAPNGGPIATVGWSSTAGRLLVRTRDGAWWRPASCDGCGGRDELLAAVRARLIGCYREINLRYVAGPVRDALGLRVCTPSPSPQAG